MTLSISELTDQFLTWFVTFGSPMLALALLLGALGIPLPGTFFVIASGAFIRQGVFDIYSTPVLALLGTVTGDSLSYGLGRFARVGIKKRFGHSATWQRAEATLAQRGGIAVYLTRWLLTPIAVPTNLVAGSGGYPLWKFLIYDVTGEITWLILFGGLGYAFGSQWELISQFVSDFSGVLVGVAAVGAGVYFLFRWQRNGAKVVAGSVEGLTSGK